MSAEKLLDRLEKVRQTGSRKWLSCCPAHEDRSPSLAVRELDDGRVLVHCFAGCAVGEVLASIGLQFEDLFPEAVRTEHRITRKQRPWNASDVLSALAVEVLVALDLCRKMLDGGVLTTADRDRLSVCARRFQAGLEVANG